MEQWEKSENDNDDQKQPQMRKQVAKEVLLLLQALVNVIDIVSDSKK